MKHKIDNSYKDKILKPLDETEFIVSPERVLKTTSIGIQNSSNKNQFFIEAPLEDQNSIWKIMKPTLIEQEISELKRSLWPLEKIVNNKYECKCSWIGSGKNLVYERYNNIKALSGSAGVKFHCPECGTELENIRTKIS